MIEDNELTFGQLLKSMIKQARLTNYEFYSQLGIAKPYFYEIIGDRTNPPPPDKQFAIIELLNPDKITKERFFDLAAKERREVPADIVKYITENDLYTKIRNEIK